MVKKISKKKKKKKVDSKLELAQYMTKASISLGAALYHARKLKEDELAADILVLALMSQKVESVAVGKHIDRLKEDGQ